jgi:SAM-dependent methyltransferase
MQTFYQIANVPIQDVLLLPTRQAALDIPRGDIALGFCPRCGFIANTAFDPAAVAYSSAAYESTQAFSSTFNGFHQALAARLVSEYDLHGKDILEIGCGQGEFLALLCELGPNRGVGFDPAYDPAKAAAAARGCMTVVKDFYSEAYAHVRADFLCCKMTLEHIPDTAAFLCTLRRSLEGQPAAVVFFQVPDITRILEEVAFWDIFYEHCSYFSPGSLARLFRSCGFEVVRLAREYGGQYLMIEARPALSEQEARRGQEARRTTPSRTALEDDHERIRTLVGGFSKNIPLRFERWRRLLSENRLAGKRAALWGAGSKAVAFLTTLDIHDEIACAVDINPRKRGAYMAGAGHPIVAPGDLLSIRPDLILAMNPIYLPEIQHDLDRLALPAQLIPVQ